VVFIRFRDPSLHLIDLTGCCILREERIILSITLCSGGVFSLRIALCVPQPRLTLSLSHLHIYIIFILLLFVIRTIWLDHLFYPYFYINYGLSLFYFSIFLTAHTLTITLIQIKINILPNFSNEFSLVTHAFKRDIIVFLLNFNDI